MAHPQPPDVRERTQHAPLWTVGMLLIVPMAFSSMPIAATYLAAWLAIVLPLGRLQHMFAIGSALAFSWLLTLRNPWQGLAEAGLGDDALHYMNAFYEFQLDYCCGPVEVIQTGIRSAGGGEPVFWFISYAIAKLTTTPLMVWWILIFCSLLLIWVAIYRSAERFAYVHFAAYLSTITLFALQGSAIRQAVATGLVMVALQLLICRRLGLAAVAGLLASGSHSSAAVLLFVAAGVVIFLSENHGLLVRGSPKLGRLGKIGVMIMFSLAALALGTSEFVVSKVQARLSENQTGSAWEAQLVLETALALSIVWLLRIRVPRTEKLIYLIFVALCLSTSLYAPAVGARLFRYTYCFYIIYLLAFFFAQPGKTIVQKKFAASLLLIASLGWAVFIVSTRYQGLFVPGGVIDHFLVSPFS